jgi:DNA-binding LytR/AlgR family response regulator
MLENNKPDLLLLDIQLSGKKDGIDVAEKVNELFPMPFIFLTANSDAETIDRAKKVKPHAYIVKPFSKDDLFAAIEIAFNNFAGKSLYSKPDETTSWPGKDHIFIKDGHIFRKIFLNEILYLESNANYVIVHLLSNKKVMVRSTINDLIEQIDQKYFIRIHRSYSVNINKIEDILPTEIVLQGISIPIGKSYKDDLFKALGIKDN